MLIYLPREGGNGIVPRTKNGPALAGHGTVTMVNTEPISGTDCDNTRPTTLVWKFADSGQIRWCRRECRRQR